MRALAFALVLFVSTLWPRRARADIDAQIAADAIVGGGTRVNLAGRVIPFASGSLYVDALLGRVDPHWNAPRLGPYVQVRFDVGDAWRSASAGAGLAVMIAGRREPNHLFRAGTLIVSFGAAYHLDVDDRAAMQSGRLAAVFGGSWGFRVSRSFAFPTMALFVHYHWVLDASNAGNQHDVLVGLQFSAATPFGLPYVLSH